MKPKTTLHKHLILVGSISLLAMSSVFAQTTYTWDITPGAIGAGDSAITGGSGAWNTANGNWTTDAGANNVAWVNAGAAPLNDAIFGGTAGTVTLGETISIRNLTFTNTAGTYTVTGNTLNFTGGTIVTPNPINTTTVGAIIQSNITGAPNINANALGTNEQFTLQPAAGGSMSIGQISGAFGNGAGVLNFQGGAGHNSTVASYSSSGPKAIFNSSGTWTVTGTITARNIEINGGTVIVSTGTLTNASSQSRAVFLSGGTLHYNNPAAVRDQNTSFGGTTTEGNDFVIAGGSIDQTSGAPITTSTFNPNMSWGGNWTFIGSNGANSNLNLGTGQVLLNATRQVTVTNASTTLTLGGVIAGAGFGLTKAGDGTLELRNATNTYTGATTVNAGTLLVNGVSGSLHGSSAVAVNTGGTLGGTGTINGATTVANGGKLSPGDTGAIGTLNFTGSLSLSAVNTASSFAFQLGSTASSDKVSLTAGALTIGTGVIGFSEFAFTAESGFGAGTYTLFDSSSTISGSLDALDLTGTIAGLPASLGLGDGTDIVLTVVPEPSSVALLGLGVFGLMRRRRRA